MAASGRWRPTGTLGGQCGEGRGVAFSARCPCWWGWRLRTLYPPPVAAPPSGHDLEPSNNAHLLSPSGAGSPTAQVKVSAERFLLESGEYVFLGPVSSSLWGRPVAPRHFSLRPYVCW